MEKEVTLFLNMKNNGEAEFQTRFGRWLKYQNLPTAAFELKISKTKSIPFSCTEEQQVPSLLAAKHGQLDYKPPDVSHTLKPCDLLHIREGDGKMVVMFEYSLSQKVFYIIDVDQWVSEQNHSKRKSLSVKRAGEIGVRCVLS